MAQTRVKSDKEIEAMRESGRMLATVLSVLKHTIEPGMSTKDIANKAKSELKKLGGKPAFYGYMGFSDVICTSVNEQIVHGIPSKDKVLSKDDLVSLDFGVNYNGMITDSAFTVIVGSDKDPENIVDITERSLFAGVDTIKGGVAVGDISAAVEKVLSQANLGIVRDLVGHGVGHELHEEPNIPNYGQAGTGPNLKAGMTIAVEPMSTLGKEAVVVENDGWTVRTRDNSLSAHFEHTILITDNGYEILTALPEDKD